MADENHQQRVNRELIELLNELRVALPGVQVLFAFLLAVPFSQRFTSASSFQRGVYFVTTMLTTLSTVLLIAPSSYHRLNFRRRNKDQILFFAQRMMVWGIAVLGLAMTGVVLLVTNVLFGSWETVAAGGVAFLMFVIVWFAIPLYHRERTPAEEFEPGLQRPRRRRVSG